MYCEGQVSGQAGSTRLLLCTGTDLNCLPVLTEDVDSHDGALPLGVRRLDDIVIEMLLPSKLVETLEDELEQGLQILGARTRDKDVGVRVQHGERDRETERGRLASTTRGGERHGLRQRLGRDGVRERQDRLGLVEGPRLGEDIADALGVGHALLQSAQFGLAFLFSPLALAGRARHTNAEIRVDRFNVLAGRDRQDVQLVVDDETRRVVAEREKEALVEAGDGRGRRHRRPVPGVNILWVFGGRSAFESLCHLRPSVRTIDML